MNIIGREEEIETLRDCYDSNRSEFVAIYGRRRIGKTYLIKELFGEGFTFYATGLPDEANTVQLTAFNAEIARSCNNELPVANNWFEAFENLNVIVERSTKNRKIIFLDEIPWMAANKSDFLTGLDYFWNRWASSRKDVFLIISGSAASWMIDNIINNTGGLHNRLTRQIALQAFTLRECEQYFASRRIPMTRYQIAEAYMIFGGVPFYLSLFDPKFSLYQNVDRIYFSAKAELGDEFENLYRSLYKNADNYISVIEALAQNGNGMTRNDIYSALKKKDGGSLTRILKNLVQSGFVREYIKYGQKKKDSLYQLIDQFSMFDIKFRDKRKEYSRDFWLKNSATPAHAAWSGFAFEKLCLLHIPQILKKLGITGVLTSVFSWRGGDEEKAQIDLVIDRYDKVINLCEMKYSSDEYTIDKKYSEALRHKRGIFVNSTGTKKYAQTTLITTYGLKRNAYSEEITSRIELDDLFE